MYVRLNPQELPRLDCHTLLGQTWEPAVDYNTTSEAYELPQGGTDIYVY